MCVFISIGALIFLSILIAVIVLQQTDLSLKTSLIGSTLTIGIIIVGFIVAAFVLFYLFSEILTKR